MNPLCFVLMPFGKKLINDGRAIYFDDIYEKFIKPAILAAGMDPLRADEEMTGGIIHKGLFERLILCEYAVADLTTANANVFYELGIRHSVRPWSTQLVFAEGWGQLPFDVGLLRALPYTLGADGRPNNAEESIISLTQKLKDSMNAKTDSPIFQMLDGYPDISRLKTDVFRERVQYAEKYKARLAKARLKGENAVAEVETELGKIDLVDAAIVVDLFLSYRAVKAWERMIDLVSRMALPLAATVMIQEQLAFALNRIGQHHEAEHVIINLIEKRGGSSESYGILGRIYKDQWEKANDNGDLVLARGFLDKAISAYLKGFEIDWRDVYPGINAVTLMEVKTPKDNRQASLLPVLLYSNERRIKQGQPDYWDFATQLEIAILMRDQDLGEKALTDAIAHIREVWEPETTARNLSLIRKARESRGEILDWANAAEMELINHTKNN